MFKNRKKNLIYFLILLIPFFLAFVRSDSLQSLKLNIARTISLPARILSYPVKEVKKILFYHRTFEEYKKLKNENDLLNARLIGLDEVVRENSRLEKLLSFKRNTVYSSVAASVIGRNPSNWNASIVINKGKLDGIDEGMPVVNDLGVIGKISQVNENTSKVILLTDPQFSVAALIEKPRESGLLSGTLQGLCRLRYINQNAKIEVGDRVITSKLSSNFPESLIIGEIIQAVENPKNNTIEYIIVPAVSFSQLEEVLVLKQ